MRKLYFIIPIILASIFLFFYLSERKVIHQRTEEANAKQQAEIQAKKKKDQEDRERARAVAVAQAAERAAEREKKRLEEEAQKAQMQAARDALADALQERERAYKQKLKLTEDRSAGDAQLRRAREQIKLQRAQLDYIKNSVKEVTAKKSIYEQSYGKLEAAERIAAANEAARLAAATPKK
ncbi:chemotaxis protein histidine kinase CheA [Ereboglobus sp. PH5-5]|uniref:hypothetical protein n=1 Tax=Ereboglobus sp. PH5-5 TaxID=2940529 RepID=UPI0024066285|nr:hypothetical protein [Ereboglobus sp. PH5-5]MDF9834141.1 chemotaxis protein histidine kinase CheA [Ereboglobus sp. PH5-5]